MLQYSRATLFGFAPSASPISLPTAADSIARDAKVVVFGNINSGKNEFIANTSAEPGAFFPTLALPNIRLGLWNVTGYTIFQPNLGVFTTNAHAVIYVCNIHDPASMARTIQDLNADLTNSSYLRVIVFNTVGQAVTPERQAEIENTFSLYSCLKCFIDCNNPADVTTVVTNLGQAVLARMDAPAITPATVASVATTATTTTTSSAFARGFGKSGG